MLRFTIRKNFYDAYDNTFMLLAMNAVLCAVAVIVAVVLAVLTRDTEMQLLNDTVSTLIALVVCIVMFIVSCVFTLAWGEVSKKICDGEKVAALDLFKTAASCILDGALWGVTCLLMTAAFCVLMYIARPANFSATNMAVSIVLCFGIFIIMTLMMQALLFYPALRAYQKNPYPKALKKCAIILLDNFMPCVTVMIHNTFIILLSLITLGLIGGIAMASMMRVNLIRNILKKYDYVEALKNKGYTPAQIFSRPIPWDRLLEADVVRYPKRNLASFIVPK